MLFVVIAARTTSKFSRRHGTKCFCLTAAEPRYCRHNARGALLQSIFRVRFLVRTKSWRNDLELLSF
jgi:hypothetical protein